MENSHEEFDTRHFLSKKNRKHFTLLLLNDLLLHFFGLYVLCSGLENNKPSCLYFNETV